MLRHLADVGVRLDAEVTVVETRPYVGTTLFTVTQPGEEQGQEVELGDPAVAAVWVTR